MKTVTRRSFLAVSGLTAAAVSIPIKSPAPATLYEAAAALCLVLTVTAAGVVCVVRLCRPRYILYFSVDEAKMTNGGRSYICLSCSKAEAEQKELTRCEGKFANLAECQVKANMANTNYLDVPCGPVSSDTALRATITLEMSGTPRDSKSWAAAAPSQIMNLNDDDPSVVFRLPMSLKSMFFRAGAKELA